ncbi:VOC family protein [Paenibacillus sp. GCM10023252]|uniref:VOC family protein n=1 Tax=Paenibacillus sp. GCM10023252 TaxID=3252649 RepID=UPI0036133B1F
MIKGIHHAQITIPRDKENEARDFYCRVLGLQEIAKPSSLEGRGGLWVLAGHQQLHIGTEEGVDRLATKAHLAYQVDDLQAIERLLVREGIEILEAVPIPGYKRFEFRDPFGNRVECIQVL